eukprot:scaffold955_cov325-Prasinococcus_capsulatus_cf.AAC.6
MQQVLPSRSLIVPNKADLLYRRERELATPASIGPVVRSETTLSTRQSLLQQRLPHVRGVRTSGGARLFNIACVRFHHVRHLQLLPQASDAAARPSHARRKTPPPEAQHQPGLPIDRTSIDAPHAASGLLHCAGHRGVSNPQPHLQCALAATCSCPSRKIGELPLAELGTRPPPPPPPSSCVVRANGRSRFADQGASTASGLGSTRPGLRRLSAASSPHSAPIGAAPVAATAGAAAGCSNAAVVHGNIALGQADA